MVEISQKFKNKNRNVINTLKQSYLSKIIFIMQIISFVHFDMAWVHSENSKIRISTLSAPSMFAKKINLSTDLFTDIPIQERANLFSLLQYIQDYFFCVPENIAKKRENYVAEVIRKEIHCKGLQLVPGIELDKIRFHNGIVYIPYVRNELLKVLKVSNYDVKYEDENQNEKLIKKDEKGYLNYDENVVPKVNFLLNSVLNSKLDGVKRNSALYKLILLYQTMQTDKEKTEFLKLIKDKNISDRISNNVLGRIQNFNESVKTVMLQSSSKAKDWALHASQNPIPRVMMAIAGPTMNCGSGVVVESLAAEHQRRGGSLALSLAYWKPILPKDLKLDETALIDTIIFGKSNEADSKMLIPVFSAGMPFNELRYKDMKSIELVEFLEVYYQRLQIFIEEYKPDVIHTNHLFLLNPLVQLIAPWIPVVSTTHGTEQKMLQEDDFMLSLVQPAIKRLDRVLSISDDITEETKKIYKLKDKNINMIGNGFDERIFYSMPINKKEFFKKHGIEGNYDKVVLYVGRFVKWKNLDYLLEAATKYSNNFNSNVLTLLVGTGSDDVVRQYQEFITDSHLSKNVKILNKWVSMEEVGKFLNVADIFALPSDNEPFSLGLLQALASGCKVIASDCGGPKMLIKSDLITNKQAILITPISLRDSKNVDSEQLQTNRYISDLADGITTLLKKESSGEERNLISNTVREYSWKNSYDKVSDVYHDIIKKRLDLYRYNFQTNKLPHVSKQVKVVEIHPTNKCNLNCDKCPYGTLHEEGATFPFENISKITAMKPEKIFVLGGGEPSMYSWEGHDIYDFIEELRKQNPQSIISLCTNGVTYLEKRLQKNVNILRVSTHGLKGEHFRDKEMPEFVKNIWNNIWRYFEEVENSVQEQWVTFLFNKNNVMDSIVIAEELWKKWDNICKNKSELRKKKFGFKLLYLADDSSLKSPFHLSNPDDTTMKQWTDEINKIKKSGSFFGEFLKNYNINNPSMSGFILPEEIAAAMLPVREAPKVNKCLLAKDHALIGADGKIYPCRIQAANAGYSYGAVSNITVEELALHRSKLFDKHLPECVNGCRLMHTLIGQTIMQYDDNKYKPTERSKDFQLFQEINQNPLEKVRNLLHNDSTYGNMSTGKWLGFPDRAELVAKGLFDEVIPVNAQFVPSERCPSNCLTCTYGRSKDEISKSSDKSKFVMSLDDMKLIIDKLADAGVQSITFTGGGDPLFNKDLFDAIEYASYEKKLATGLFTEAHLITDEIAERMVNVGLKFIRVSFNAGRPITYKHFFGVPETIFYKSLENIEKLAAAKEKFNKKLGLGVGVIITPLNFLELMEIARLIQAIADRHPETISHIWYRPTVRYFRGVQLENPKTKDCLNYIKRHPDLNKYYDAYHAFTYDGKQFPALIFQEAMENLENTVKPFIESKVNGLKIFYPKTRIEAMDEIDKGFTRCRACPWLTFVGSDGSVYHCVEHGLDPKAIYGNLKTHTLKEIWQSQKRKDVIKFMEEEGLAHRCPPMCMLTEHNRIFEAISDSVKDNADRESLTKAIKSESDVFMEKIGKKLGDGIKFMSFGSLFTLGTFIIYMGDHLFLGKLLIITELFLMATFLLKNIIAMRADKKSIITDIIDRQKKSDVNNSDGEKNILVPTNKLLNFTILSLFHDRYVFYAESLGSSVIKAYLKEQFQDKVNVDIIDLQFKRDIDTVLKELSINPPDIIGLSAKVLTYSQMMDILEKRKQYSSFAKKKTLFVVGNITGATTYKEIIAKHKDVMVVVGEGEEASRDLVLFLRGEKSIGEISNTAYWDSNKNKCVLNPSYNTCDFSKFPAPDRKNAEETLKNNGVVYAEFSRGCSWGSCTFCSMWECQKREWRHKPIDLLLKELDDLKRMGAKRFEFTDSDFMGPNMKKVSDLDMYREFATKKIQANNELKFFVYLRIHSVYCKDDTEELRQAKINTLKLLKKAGMQVVNIGGDYGSDKQGKRFNKGTTKEEVREAIRILEGVGIENIKLGMILFDPFMSFDEIVEGMNFIKKAKLEKYINFPFARLTFYETSPLTKLAKSNGIFNEERTDSLALKATDFLDQRIGRLSRIFDTWHNNNKPLIFGIQEIRREGEVNNEIQNKAHDILEKIRQQYYYFLDNMVSSYISKDRDALEKVIFKHLELRSGYCKELFELLQDNRGRKACNDVYRSAIELYYSDILMIEILQDSAKGNFLNWKFYQDLLDLEPGLSDEDKEKILEKTFIRVQEQIKFRNPKLRIPNPDIKKIKKEVEISFNMIAKKVSIISGISQDIVTTKLRQYKNDEKGVKLLWGFGNCLKKVYEPKKNELMTRMNIDAVIKYLLMLSWELECGNDDLVFIDKYGTENNADIEDLQQAINYCFNEIDVNNRNSITAKKVLLSVQINAFDINEIPRILANDKTELFTAHFDKGEQLSKRNIIVPEIDQLVLDNRVFNPVLHYQMTGVLANIIPDMTNKKVLDIGTGTGILGIVSAQRGADSVVELDINKHACELSLLNSQNYGVSEKVDVRFVTDEMHGRFFEAINSSEKFDVIITNPPWGSGAMIGYLGKALSDPKQEFLQYFLKEAPNHLNKNGEILIGYSSRNDYDEKTLIDVINSLKGLVDYDWKIIGSLEFTRPLYSEIFYAVRLKLANVRPTEEYINNRRAKVIKAYNYLKTNNPIQVEDNVEKIVLAVTKLIHEIDGTQETKEQIEIIKKNIGMLYIDSIISSVIVKAKAVKRMGQQLLIGLDTSLVPVLSEIIELEKTLTQLGLENVKFIISEGDKLAIEVSNAMKSKNNGYVNDTTFDNIIILANEEVIESKNFAIIKSGKNNIKPFIARAYTIPLQGEYKKISHEHLYMSMIKILTITLEAFLGIDVSALPSVNKVDKHNNEITFILIEKNKNHETLKERDNGQFFQAA